MSWNADIVGKAIYYQLRNLCEGRIYPVIAPENCPFPFMVYQIISTVPNHTKDSTSLVDTMRVQVAILDKTYGSVCELSSQVRDQIDFITGTYAGVNIDGLRFAGALDMPYNISGIFHKNQDYMIRVKNAIEDNNMDNIQKYDGKTSDFAATDVIPAGYAVEMVVFENTTNKNAQLSCGTTAAGNNVFSGEIINKGLSTISVNKTFSMSGFTSLYFNHTQDGDTWNNITANIFVIIRKIK